MKRFLFLVKVGASLGVDKLRLTGGEPTIRPGVVDLVRQMAAIPGMRDVAMTTNALLLDELAQPLADAGLNRVNISIDTIDAERFRRITRWGDIEDVWRGIAAAERAGLRPVKLNCVVTRGFQRGGCDRPCPSDTGERLGSPLHRDDAVRRGERLPAQPRPSLSARCASGSSRSLASWKRRAMILSIPAAVPHPRRGPARSVSSAA